MAVEAAVMVGVAAVVFSAGVLAGHILRTARVERLKDDLDAAVEIISEMRADRVHLRAALTKAREQLKWENQRARAMADVARFQRDTQILAEYEAEFRGESA